jgi:TPR repeat protein
MSFFKNIESWKKLLLIIATATALCGCMNGQYFVDKGKQNYYAKRYRKAFINLKEGAEKNNADAQYALGYMYYYGEGVTEDKQKALFWFNRAALNGHEKAIEALNRLKHASSH